MSNILKPIDLTDRAIRRTVFAVLDGLAAQPNRKGDVNAKRLGEVLENAEFF
jgi:hypothetical protein